ncbi:MAG: hypothetical protein IPM54_04740 [Polyangiaceae bacterium]|nr:hypothetical protein [Polyangiaceae bacterium]
MSRIDVDKKSLEGAWKRHEELGRKNPAHDDHLLLLLYAVECCLNHCLMSREKLHHTSRIPEDARFGHAIDRLAAKLGAPEIRGYTAETPSGTYIAPENLHSLFRYGGRLTRQDRDQLLHSLQSVLNWAAENQS